MLRFIPIVAFALLLAGCPRGERAPVDDGSVATAAAIIVDDFGDTLRVTAPPRRIVSLNPTTTEILFALGAGDRLVGRSRWDEWPAAARRVPAVGDGIRPNVEAVLAVRPDLVVLYASADNRGAAARLRGLGIATLAVKADSLATFRRVATALGAATGTGAAARVMVDTVHATLERVRRLTSGRARPTVLWRVWQSPLLVIGGGSYLDELVEIAGGRNAFGDLPQPSPQVTFEEVVRRDPDMLAVSADDTAGLRADVRWRRLRAVRDGSFLVVDDDVTGRTSVRIGEAAVLLASQLHPELADSLRGMR